MKKIIILTGAGISAESGLNTFRDADGLWEGYNIEDVATPEAWQRNPELVQQFYNDRRKSVMVAQPNPAHLALAKLESKFETLIITQNIDDLHERGGSKAIIHLHGEIMYSRSSRNPALLYKMNSHEIKMGEMCELGSQLRPHVVWFGEAVPMITKAMYEMPKADMVILIGSSLAVYPAAGLLELARADIPVYVIDPKIPSVNLPNPVIKIKERASIAVPLLVEKLLKNE
ncbi:MAG: NAD-dependent deacylase [Bacteroidetes bacterium]|nr:NAD-dependent deacylase [Bacteroidota bacterium]MBU1373670.1 NAD-dependent deacylase [Bacteroidota bacterium]MBU1484067.1 NAD-dependent deacylase [Bacteroidota bacterium]MBU1759962.1 NAD-dependent deacylase [Bacteroidota bacterium]MBU2268439.1 NAD-dependent deacylase [Bacteroidota bacterium]